MLLGHELAHAVHDHGYESLGIWTTAYSSLDRGSGAFVGANERSWCVSLEPIFHDISSMSSAVFITFSTVISGAGSDFPSVSSNQMYAGWICGEGEDLVFHRSGGTLWSDMVRHLGLPS